MSFDKIFDLAAGVYFRFLYNMPEKCFVFYFIFLFFSFFSWSGLFCCVLVPGTLALHLIYLDELRVFGLLCFTVVCDHRIYFSLG